MLKVFKNCKHEWEAMLQTRFSNNQVSRTNRTNTNVQFSTIQSSKRTNASCSPGHHPADSYLKLSYTDKTSQYSEGKECSSIFFFCHFLIPLGQKKNIFQLQPLFRQIWGLILLFELLEVLNARGDSLRVKRPLIREDLNVIQNISPRRLMPHFFTSDGSKPYKPWRTLDTDDDDN